MINGVSYEIKINFKNREKLRIMSVRTVLLCYEPIVTLGLVAVVFYSHALSTTGFKFLLQDITRESS